MGEENTEEKFMIMKFWEEDVMRRKAKEKQCSSLCVSEFQVEQA